MTMHPDLRVLLGDFGVFEGGAKRVFLRRPRKESICSKQTITD